MEISEFVPFCLASYLSLASLRQKLMFRLMLLWVKCIYLFINTRYVIKYALTFNSTGWRHRRCNFTLFPFKGLYFVDGMLQYASGQYFSFTFIACPCFWKQTNMEEIWNEFKFKHQIKIKPIGLPPQIKGLPLREAALWPQGSLVLITATYVVLSWEALIWGGSPAGGFISSPSHEFKNIQQNICCGVRPRWFLKAVEFCLSWK